MNIEKIFDDIKFKVSPKDDYRSSYRFRFIKSFYKIFKKEKNYVFDNCIINKEKIDLDLRKELIKIDSMSTYAIGYLINRICKNLSKNQIYLNIGCWKGFSLVAGMINTECKVIGVDNFSQFTGPKNDFLKNFENSKKSNHFFFEQDYQKYFESLDHTKDKFDFYFYDGEHSYDNQFKNLEIADNFLNVGSLVLIDDINFDEVYEGTLDFINKTKSRFRIIKEIKTANNHCHPSFLEWNNDVKKSIILFMSNLLDKKCVPCEGGVKAFDISEIHKYQKKVDGWKIVQNDKKVYLLEKKFEFKNFLESQKFVNEVGRVSEDEGHHPDIMFGWGYAKINITTHAIEGLSENDFILAAKIDEIINV